MNDPRFTIRDWLWTVALIALTTLMLVQQTKLEHDRARLEWQYSVLLNHESRLLQMQSYHDDVRCPSSGE